MRRWIGLALALVGIVTLVLLFVSNPPPAPYEGWALRGEGGGHLYVAIGPALASYDSAADETRLLFWCGHQRCPDATTLAGDQRALADEPSVVLYSAQAPPIEGNVSMSTPMRDGDRNVTTTTAARFEPGAAWFTLSLYQGAFILLAVGVSVAAGATASRLFAELLGLGIGLAVGTILAPLWAAFIVPLFVTGLVGAAAAITAVSARWWPRLGHVAAALVAAFVALLFSAIVTADFFAHAPTL